MTHPGVEFQGKVTVSRTRCNLSHREEGHKRTFQALSRLPVPPTHHITLGIRMEREVGPPGLALEKLPQASEGDNCQGEKKKVFITCLGGEMNHVHGGEAQRWQHFV